MEESNESTDNETASEKTSFTRRLQEGKKAVTWMPSVFFWCRCASEVGATNEVGATSVFAMTTTTIRVEWF